MSTLCLEIPSKFNNFTKEIEIPCLGIKTPLKDKKQALKTVLTELKTVLNKEISGISIQSAKPQNAEQLEDEYDRFTIIIDNYKPVLNKVLELEPMVETGEEERKKKKQQRIEESSLILASPEEIIDYGYDYE